MTVDRSLCICLIFFFKPSWYSFHLGSIQNSQGDMDLQTLEGPLRAPCNPTCRSGQQPCLQGSACWGGHPCAPVSALCSRWHTARSVAGAKGVLAGDPISFPWPSPLIYIFTRMSVMVGFVFPNLGCHTNAQVTDSRSI